jgi:hypothetical protein
VDNLLAAGYRDLSVLDVSEAALKISRDRLGAGTIVRFFTSSPMRVIARLMSSKFAAR